VQLAVSDILLTSLPELEGLDQQEFISLGILGQLVKENPTSDGFMSAEMRQNYFLG